MEIEQLIEKVNRKHIWDSEPVYCFTSDIDWASESVMQRFFNYINPHDLKPTLFVTHESKLIENEFKAGKIDRGIHPNFLPDSDHGNSYDEIIKTCINFAPESKATRSHRAYEVTDTSHLLNSYGFKYSSNTITCLQANIRPVLLESGLINFPVFFEDGTHLFNDLNLNMLKYECLLRSPGIKIISFHPMNLVINSPTLKYMREIKNFLSRQDYKSISHSNIENLENRGLGIRNTVFDIIKFVKYNKYKILSLKDIYEITIL